jgi:hypothetical protein
MNFFRFTNFPAFLKKFPSLSVKPTIQSFLQYQCMNGDDMTMFMMVIMIMRMSVHAHDGHVS